jgi:hypothetical protein
LRPSRRVSEGLRFAFRQCSAKSLANASGCDKSHCFRKLA